MKPISLADIRNLHEYELERPEFRRRLIELKRRRRVALGPLMTLVFENRDTVRFQIQEMLRVERIVRPEKVQAEIEVYNELLPGAGEVAATLLIEVTDPERVAPILDGFVGLDEPGKLTLTCGGEGSLARFAPGQSREDRISAVHYVRFPVGGRMRRAIEEREPVTLAVHHGDYHAVAVLAPETVEELRRDLAQA
ncbi:MAG TPA: DUF3501 family protein [Thermoanaerobaculia bacterium]|nr:DUF3501 family protein [Thermoanaerobaculia bacterium]